MIKGLLTLAISLGILFLAWAVETTVDRYRPQLGVVWRFLILFAIAVAVMALAVSIASARDDGRYAGSPLKPWFDSLRSGRGPCCSDADGATVDDVDWDSRDGHYRVRIPLFNAPGAEWGWVDVPGEAVITEPNRAGRTMVWPLYGIGGVSIRCFMPGSMT